MENLFDPYSHEKPFGYAARAHLSGLVTVSALIHPRIQSTAMNFSIENVFGLANKWVDSNEKLTVEFEKDPFMYELAFVVFISAKKRLNDPCENPNFLSWTIFNSPKS